MSDAVIAPERFTSIAAFAVAEVCPACPFTSEMSVAFTERELFSSPTRNPTDAAKFEPGAVHVEEGHGRPPVVGHARERHLHLAAARGHVETVPTVVVAPPVEVTGVDSWKTMRWPLPIARGSTVTLPVSALRRIDGDVVGAERGVGLARLHGGERDRRRRRRP
jgi:hypothetical protein